MLSKIGTGELIILLIIALFVIGPDKLPGIAKSAGKLLATARHYMKDIMSEVESEISSVGGDIKDVESEIKKARDTIQEPFQNLLKGDGKSKPPGPAPKSSAASGPAPGAEPSSGDAPEASLDGEGAQDAPSQIEAEDEARTTA